MNPKAREDIFELLVQQKIAGATNSFRREIEQHGITEAEVEAEVERRLKKLKQKEETTPHWALWIVIAAVVLLAVYLTVQTH
jgi:hypothetical protein